MLTAALNVIRRDGASVSMEAMAAEAGITKPILYRHFGDRDGLLAAVADRFADELVCRLSEELAAGGRPRDSIAATVRSYVEFISEDPPLYAFLTQWAPVASPVLAGLVDRAAALLAATISERLAEAGLDARPAETWAYGVVGMVHLVGSRVALLPDESRAQVVEDLIDLVADGLLGPAVAAGLPEVARQAGATLAGERPGAGGVPKAGR